MGLAMHRLFLGFAVSAVVMLATAPRSWSQTIDTGNTPDWSGYGAIPESQAAGCWRWNWQQKSWYDHCWWANHHRVGPSRVVVKTKG
jgi:hypothetical protein